MTNKQEKIRRYDSVEEEKNKENTGLYFFYQHHRKQMNDLFSAVKSSEAERFCILCRSLRQTDFMSTFIFLWGMNPPSAATLDIISVRTL